MENSIKLYHVGFVQIEDPDLERGRKNADFGPGFYLSDDFEFSKRWAKERIGQTTYINSYELNLDGLQIKKFERNMEWFQYIFQNRHSLIHKLPKEVENWDVIYGPIANDTIYDVFGIPTSGLLSDDIALQILQCGNEYHQLVIRSEKAKQQLKWLGADIIPSDEIKTYASHIEKEAEEFQLELTNILENE